MYGTRLCAWYLNQEQRWAASFSSLCYTGAGDLVTNHFEYEAHSNRSRSSPFTRPVVRPSFAQSVETGRQRANALTQQPLDSTNAKVFADAFLTAKIIGYDRAEIDQLKADMQEFRRENATSRCSLKKNRHICHTGT